MSIGFLKQCMDGVPGVEGGHVHAPEVRTFDSIDDLEAVKEIIQNKYLRAAVAAGPGGAVSVVRRDDGKFGCAYHLFAETMTEQVFESLTDVEHWLKGYVPSVHIPVQNPDSAVQ